MLNERKIFVEGKGNIIFRKVNYPGINSDIYYISEFGDLYNALKNELVTGAITAGGYKQYSVNRISMKAHRLVAYEFVEKNRDIKLTIDHLDGNKLNNHYTNLEWVTIEENLRRAFLSGRTNMSTLTFYPDELVHKICEMYQDYNYSPIDVYRILKGTNATPRGNKMDEAFYRFLVSLRKKETHYAIAMKYDYNSNEEFGNKRLPGANNLFSVEQIKIIANLYIAGNNIPQILRTFQLKPNDINYNRYYTQAFNIVTRKSWTHLTDEIFKDKEFKKPKRATNARFSEKEVHDICQLLSEGSKPKFILNKLGYKEDDINYKRMLDIISRIANGRVYTEISKNYFKPFKLAANRKEYNLNKELIEAMVSHGYEMKDICRVYGMKKKSDDPNLYRAILQVSSKFKKSNKSTNIMMPELQNMMMNEWAANW